MAANDYGRICMDNYYNDSLLPNWVFDQPLLDNDEGKFKLLLYDHYNIWFT